MSIILLLKWFWQYFRIEAQWGKKKRGYRQLRQNHVKTSLVWRDKNKTMEKFFFGEG